ncbi:uncharacterized protein [Argopecten irradians]|uniref:uncharacterized protein isoform X2 n=1 Tax=Argopecten irradians TaxID=31199 RepID=UPI00371C4B07
MLLETICSRIRPIPEVKYDTLKMSFKDELRYLGFLAIIYILKADPCTEYADFNVTETSAPSYIETNHTISRCDATITQQWYRISGAAGTDLATSEVNSTNCGTQYPMWMTSNIPVQSDGEVDRTVCVVSPFSTCHSTVTIKVKNCNCEYRVYFLVQATSCPSSYCVDSVSEEPCSPTTTTTTKTTTEKEETAGSTSLISSDSKETSDSKGMVVGIILAMVVVLAIAIALIAYNLKKKKKPSRTAPSVTNGEQPQHGIDCQVEEERRGAPEDADPCLSTNHVILDDEWRSTDNVITSLGDAHCDATMIETWYRVNHGILGNIATSAPALDSCGTQYPVWMDDDLPVTGVTSSVSMCLRTMFSDCQATWTIDVKNCSTFNVYELKQSTVCSSAYCFDPGSPTTTTTAATTTTDATTTIEATTTTDATTTTEATTTTDATTTTEATTTTDATSTTEATTTTDATSTTEATTTTDATSTTEATTTTDATSTTEATTTTDATSTTEATTTTDATSTTEATTTTDATSTTEATTTTDATSTTEATTTTDATSTTEATTTTDATTTIEATTTTDATTTTEATSTTITTTTKATTTTIPVSTSKHAAHEGISTGALVGIVFAMLLLVVIIIVVFLLILDKVNGQFTRTSNMVGPVVDPVNKNPIDKRGTLKAIGMPKSSSLSFP